jgi:hypothetical protein
MKTFIRANLKSNFKFARMNTLSFLDKYYLFYRLYLKFIFKFARSNGFIWNSKDLKNRIL